MYVGNHYNSYYNSLYGNSVSSAYGMAGSMKTAPNYTSPLNSSNSTSSFYNQDSFSSAALKYVQDLKSGSAGVNAALNSLKGGVFNQTTAVSSDTAAMTVKANASYGKYNNNATSVMINQVAAGQQNTGSALKSGANVQKSGYQQFAIETNGKTYQFSFEVSATDTNKDLQQKMADAINKKGIGITASVSTEKNNSTLSLKSDTTGETAKSSFQIRDVSGSAVAQTGVGQVTQQAQNALYSVNGGAQKSSQTNTVDLGNGLTATLKKASDEAVTVSRGADKDAAISKVQDLANSYNKMYGAALNNSDDSKATQLFSRMVSNSRTYSSTLSDIGIGFDNNGYMTVDKEKLSAASDSGKLESFFKQSSNYGFTSQLSRMASDVNNNTQQYVDKNSFATDLQSSLFSNTQYSTMQNSWNTLSMLFNFSV